MFVNSVAVDVVGGAYIIAANYFKHNGRIPVEMNIFQPLFDSSVDAIALETKTRWAWQTGAIARFESFSDEIA